MTHRRHHFLEDLARCGPPGVSLLGRKAKILTRLRRGLGLGQLETRKDDEPDSPPPLLPGGCLFQFSLSEFSGSIVMLDISAGVWPLAPRAPNAPLHHRAHGIDSAPCPPANCAELLESSKYTDISKLRASTVQGGDLSSPGFSAAVILSFSAMGNEVQGNTHVTQRAGDGSRNREGWKGEGYLINERQVFWRLLLKLVWFQF